MPREDTRRRRHTRRRARWAGLRALRLVRRHYLSMVTAGILGGALFVALTSSALENPERASSQAVTANSTPRPTATPGIMPTSAPSRSLQSRLLVYYLVASAQRQREMEIAVQSDLVYQLQRGGQNQGPATYRYFLVVNNPQEEAAARDLFQELFFLAPTEGYSLRVVDMR